jgi:hypothetical protein
MTNPYAGQRNITHSPTAGNVLLNDRLLEGEAAGAAQASAIKDAVFASANGLALGAAQLQFDGLIAADGDYALNMREDLTDALLVASDSLSAGSASAITAQQATAVGPKFAFAQNDDNSTRLYLVNDGPHTTLCRFRMVGGDTTIQLESAESGDGATLEIQLKVAAGVVHSLGASDGIMDATLEPVGDKCAATAAVTGLVLAEGATTSGNPNAGAVQDHRMLLGPGAEVDVILEASSGTYTVTDDAIWMTELKVQLATGPLA